MKFINPPIKTLFTKTTTAKVEERRLSFCFEHASLENGCLCFDNPRFEPSDMIELVKVLKYISGFTIKDIQDNMDTLRFHSVNLSHKAYLKHIYRKSIKYSGSDDQIPTLFQLEVFTDNSRGVAPRLTFYILIDCIGKIVYFDYQHLLCSEMYGVAKSIPEDWFSRFIK